MRVSGTREKPFDMNYPFSRPNTGAGIYATVKWYDPSKGYGFLVPRDGSPDNYCRESALAAVGLETLLAGATVACETVQGVRGPEVSPILGVDFSTASPRTASHARHPGNGSIAVAPGAGQAGPAASSREVRVVVKWLHVDKGHGFLEREDGFPDIYCHLTAVQASGYDTLRQGAAVTCEVVQGDRGPQLARIISVEVPAAEPGPEDGGRFVDARCPDPQAGAPPSDVMELSGTVKFFNPARGFGFVVPNECGREEYVHSSVLFRSGMTDLEPGQRVLVRAESVPCGLQATEIERL